jgi:streptomycin 6-kinase
VYETGAILRNLWNDTLTQPEIRRILLRRVDQFAEELGFDRERIRAWGLAQAVLSAIWSAEDGGTGWEGAMACAQALAT